MKILFAKEALKSPNTLTGRMGKGKGKMFEVTFTPGKETKIKEDEYKVLYDESGSVLKWLIDEDFVIEKAKSAEEVVEKLKSEKKELDDKLKDAESEVKKVAKEVKKKPAQPAKAK